MQQMESETSHLNREVYQPTESDINEKNLNERHLDESFSEENYREAAPIEKRYNTRGAKAKPSAKQAQNEAHRNN
ncbi:hypothetical protein HI914_02091 [Erysiphe necator]|nr:hypothetical protein HI914_02091 [Erysiphe necator]